MSTQSYSNLTKAFHWTTALLILCIIPLGLIANDMAYDTSDALGQKAWLFSLHKTLGVTVFFVAVLRILWALTQTKPGPLHPERKAENLLAEIVHWLLYISLVLAPLSGWIDHAATSGFAPIWWPFGQNLPLVPKSETLSHLFAGLHVAMSKVMIAAILLHIAGALKHAIIDRDATLSRMWFSRATPPQTTAHQKRLLPPVIAAVVTIAALAVGGLLASRHTLDTAEAAPLAEVASDWQVTDGTLEITVTQFGNQITGSFGDWTADIRFDPDGGPDYGAVDVTVSIGSLTLGSVTSQALGADFFNQAGFPTASFTGPIAADGDRYKVDGLLTLKGTSAPVTLTFALGLDGDIATMEGSTTIDRQTFNIGETMPDETNIGFAVNVNTRLTATRNAP